MRTILHVLGSAELEAIGLAKIAVAAARAAPAGTRVLATFMDGDGPLVGRVRRAGIDAQAIYWGGVRNLAGNFRAWRHFRALAPDIVHQHFGGGYLRGIAKAAGVPRIIAHFHGHGAEVQGKWSVPHSSVFADAAIATSRSVGTMIRGRVEPTVIYPCVVPLRAAASPVLEAKAPVIGALSRVALVKGHLYLVRAMPAVLARVPQARLEIAGDGPEIGTLRAEIARLGLTDFVTMLGWQDDLDPLFERWRVFAAPSLIEGFGISVLEAAMRGLPIVASQVGGIPELIEDGVSGLLVPPEEPDALAGALVTLLTDKALGTCLGKAAAVRAATNFAPDTFLRAMSAVYERL